ncbi:helix-turn-helix domain-containing protein [Alloalcanivorax xenomutans]|uniref:TetR/AcrR family transcriptional regulator n=1 Tax=Alloalcanivorax xenomutans TaxID=1094342 RepID=UPI0029346E46|nr:helix-turn-helix domain-containing protein [Alloalcanivorax xenomutans]WOD29803.1 helix-turn-helix domain-containing protein [Alloalcanivorax xenomutans]
MTGTRPKQRRRPRVRPTREQTRERILAAADAVFRERGFHPSRIEEIAERAGFTKGAVYSSFANKDEIFLDLLVERVAQRSRYVIDKLAQVEPGKARARALGVALTDLMDLEPDWPPLLLEFWIHALRDTALRERLGALRMTLRRSVVDALGSDASLPAEWSATLVFALANGLGLERITDSRAVPDSLLPMVLERVFATA